jgi:manganese efflux pump family protein
MMNFLDIIFLSIALAMDCFTVAIVAGVIMKEAQWKTILRMSFLFGFFQALMPFCGWTGFTYFAKYIEAFDHWIAFGLLAFLGIRMIREALQPDEEEKHFNPAKWKTQVSLAVATSIDALAIGISFACTEYHHVSQLAFPLSAIGITSFLFGVFGCLLGIKFGRHITKRFQPELLGGIILILIGIKVLASHLLGW